MTLELLYDDKGYVFMENVTNISVGNTQVFFRYNNSEVTILVKDLLTATLFTNDWQHTIRHWVFT